MAVVKLRAATRADLQRFYPGSEKVLPTMNALVGLVDGRIVGIGGVTRIAGRRTAFSARGWEAQSKKPVPCLVRPSVVTFWDSPLPGSA